MNGQKRRGDEGREEAVKLTLSVGSESLVLQTTTTRGQRRKRRRRERTKNLAVRLASRLIWSRWEARGKEISRRLSSGGLKASSTRSVLLVASLLHSNSHLTRPYPPMGTSDHLAQPETLMYDPLSNGPCVSQAHTRESRRWPTGRRAHVSRFPPFFYSAGFLFPYRLISLLLGCCMSYSSHPSDSDFCFRLQDTPTSSTAPATTRSKLKSRFWLNSPRIPPTTVLDVDEYEVENCSSRFSSQSDSDTWILAEGNKHDVDAEEADTKGSVVREVSPLTVCSSSSK